MPRTSEFVFNSYFAELLRSKHPLWRNAVHVEQTGLFSDNPRLQPDIVVVAPKMQPVAIEIEYIPAKTVEDDATGRLGLRLVGTDETIEHALAIRVPLALRLSQGELTQKIAEVSYEYCVLTRQGNLAPVDRFPNKGWLSGSIDDIAVAIEHTMLSQRLVDASIEVLERGIRNASQVIRDSESLGYDAIATGLGRVLNQLPGEQTTRMSMAIIANAITFHAMVSGRERIPPLNDVVQNKEQSLTLGFLNAWRFIYEEINYWPVFKVAYDLLKQIRSPTANRLLQTLVSVADQLADIGVTTRHDLAGKVFQRLIVDRKYLATFYTLPTSSALLAELAVNQMNFDWLQLDAYPKLRVADFSCGTGTLLSAAYHALLSRFRHGGRDDASIHASMIENSIIGADIMPSATHLCVSQLSSVHPTVPFENTRIYTMPYGLIANADGTKGTYIGSLDLIDSAHMSALFTTGLRRSIGSKADEEVLDIEIPHDSIDLVILNPPFTRPTNHKVAAVPIPSFAGFGTSEQEQRAMSDRLSTIRGSLSSPVGNGNAGLASNFIDLAHAKIREGGVLAVVLPITVLRGAAWHETRSLLRSSYHKIIVVTLATNGSHKRAFSADTNLAEVLLVATKLNSGSNVDRQALFVNLDRRPENLLEAIEAAKLVAGLEMESNAGQLFAGDQAIGSYIRAPLEEGGCAALRQTSLAHTTMSLRRGELALPRLHPPLQLPFTRLGDLGQRGLLHRDIGTKHLGRPPFRGPFTIQSLGTTEASYPVLWNHKAANERCLTVHPDSEGIVREGCEKNAVDVWNTATRLHFNLDFSLTSQSIVACLTPANSLGGRAWPNFRLKDEAWQELITLWSNCTLGLMSFWWSGSRQHTGRSIHTLSNLPNVVTLDPRKLTLAQLRRASQIYESFHRQNFLPAADASQDEVRQNLDEKLLVDLLGLDNTVLESLSVVRNQWCKEPSVNGGRVRPK